MIELTLEHEAVAALIKILNAQKEPLSWHLLDALDTLQEEYNNEAERRHSALYDYEGPRAEND